MSANEELLDRYVERYNAGDLDGVMDLYAEDAVQNMPDGAFVGRDAIRERLARELIAFPDVSHAVRSFVEQGDAFCDEWTFAGTHTGLLLLPDGRELAPTGTRIEIRGMEYSWVLERAPRDCGELRAAGAQARARRRSRGAAPPPA